MDRVGLASTSIAHIRLTVTPVVGLTAAASRSSTPARTRPPD